MTTITRLSGDYCLDAERTTIGFVARHRMATRVRGRFAVFEGAAHLDGDGPENSNAWIMIQAGSIETGHQQRDAQLSKEFLDAAAYPTITFVSTTVEQTGATTFEVTGDLTVRGVTRAITVPFELIDAEGNVTFAATLEIDRRQWRVNWNALTTMLVSPTVVLDLQLTATRRG